MPRHSHTARILLADRDRTTFKMLDSILAQDGYDIITTDKGNEVFALAVSKAPALIILDADLPGVDGYLLSRRLRSDPATCAIPIIMLTGDDRIPSRLAAFEAGVDDYVVKPFHPKELSYRIRNLIGRHPTSTPEPEEPVGARGRVTAFFAPKGGVGKTMLSINFAAALVQRGAKRVAILDADFALGAVGVGLDLPPTHTISELVDRFDQVDEDLLAQVMVPHSSGIHILQSPLSPEQSELITPDHVKRILQLMASAYDHVVVDCQSVYDERMLTVLEMVDDVMFVTTPEIHVLKNGVSFFALVNRMNIASDKFHVLLNRADSNQALKHADIETALKRPIDFQVHSDGRAILQSANRGVPLVLDQPHHPISVQMLKMADAFLRLPPAGAADAPEQEPKNKPRTFKPKVFAAPR